MTTKQRETVEPVRGAEVRPAMKGTRRLPKRLAFGAAAVAVLLAAACGDDSDDGATPPGDATGQEDASGENAAAGVPGDRSADLGPDAEPLGSSTGQHEAAPIDNTLVPLHLDVLRLQRNGDLVELDVQIRNDHESVAFEPWSNLSDGSTELPETAGGITVVDEAGQMAYMPALVGESDCLCSSGLSEIAINPGDTAIFNASFGGIPPEVNVLDVHVPGFAAVLGVEVQG